jgi:ABC-type polysaccharide/polyol phosphate transport system ATPase subunit
MNQGRTAILVNHEMSQVRRMSQHCLWLRRGQVEMFGPTNEVVSYYEQETGGPAESSLKAPELAHFA